MENSKGSPRAVRSEFTYDFQNPAHREMYFRDLGLDEEMAREKFPHLYASLTQPEEDCGGEQTAPVGLEDSFPIQFLQVSGNRTSEEALGAAPHNTQCVASSSYVTPKKLIALFYKFFDSKHKERPAQIASPAFQSTNRTAFSAVVPKVPGAGGRSLYTAECIYTAYEAGKPPAAKRVTQQELREGEMSAVTGVTVTRPVKDSSPPTYPEIVVCYERATRVGETADEVYEDVKVEESGGVKTCKVHLKTAGSLTINSDLYRILDIDYDSLLLNVSLRDPKQGGGVYFNKSEFEMQNLFRVSDDRLSVTWELPDPWNWKADLDMRLVSNNAYLTYYLYIPMHVYFVDDPTQYPLPVSALVQSNPGGTPPDSSTRYIPHIWLWWGCLGEDAPVAMADGSQKLIQDIQPGDRVRAGEGSAAVRDILTGTEERMIRLETKGGGSVLLSGTHPVMTARGFLPAKDLTAADAVLTLGGYEEISCLLWENYEGRVYNLLLDSPEGGVLYCGGVAVGDAVGQQRAQAEAPPETTRFSPWEDPVENDLLALSRYLEAQNQNDGAQGFTRAFEGSSPIYACGCDDGLGRYGSIPVELSRFPGGRFTLDLWALPQGRGRSLLSQEKGFTLFLDGDSAFFAHPALGEQTLRAKGVLDNAWNHIAVRYDGGFLSMGLNGVFERAVAVGRRPLLREGELQMGRHFTGMLRRLILWNRAVPDGELRRRMFENAPAPGMEGIVSFVDCASGKIRDLAEDPQYVQGYNAFGCGSLSWGYLPGEGRFASLGRSPDLNPGKGDFSLVLKVYTGQARKDRFVLLSNGCFGEEGLVLYSDHAGPMERSLGIQLGGREYTLAPSLPDRAWLDLVVVYDREEKSVAAYVNGEAQEKQKVVVKARPQGNMLVGNGFDAKDGAADYASEYRIASAAVFDLPLTARQAAEYFKNQPGPLDKGITALFRFDGSGLGEPVSGRRILMDAGDLAPVYALGEEIGPDLDRWSTGRTQAPDPMSERLLDLLILCFEELFGLDCAPETQDRRWAVCGYLQRTLLKDPAVRAPFQGRPDRAALLRLLGRLDGAFTAVFTGLTLGDTAQNRRRADLAHKVGSAAVHAASPAIAQALGGLTQRTPDQEADRVLAKLLELLRQS